MTGNKYDLALQEVRSVLRETLDPDNWSVPSEFDLVATAVVDRLVAKGVIQSTDPEDLGYRTGPLEPGRKITGGES